VGNDGASLMPEAPVPFARLKSSGVVSLAGDAMEPPATAGIYFDWFCGRVVYVGTSYDLSQRVRPEHEKIRHGDYLSWLTVNELGIDACLQPRQLELELLFAECFYIWRHKPKRNFCGYKKRPTGGAAIAARERGEQW
jgi:hypothetical protein